MTNLESKQELLKKTLKEWEKERKDVAVTETFECSQVDDEATLAAVVVLNNWEEYYEEIKDDPFVKSFGDRYGAEIELETETEFSRHVLTWCGWELVDWQVW